MSQSQNISYNPNLDELRGLACLMVFINHAGILTNGIAPYFGLIGVMFFFILSGFLFTSLFDKKPSIIYKYYYYNRFLRIIPMTIFYLSLILVFFHSFKRSYILHLWTIPIELCFYLIFPILFFLYKKNIMNIVLLTLPAFVLQYFHFLLPPNGILYGSFKYFISFLLGIGLYYIYAKVSIPKKYINLLLYLNISIFIVLIVFREYLIFRLFMFDIFCFSFIFLFLQKDKIIKIFFYLGKISFSFYILHFICIHLMTKFVPSHHYISSLLAFILTILLSILTYNIIEKPFMSLRKKY